MKNVNVIMEKDPEGFFHARIEDHDSFLPLSCQPTIKEVVDEMKSQISEFIDMTDNVEEKVYWSNVLKSEWDFQYDLQALFDTFNEIKISAIAKRAGINESLVRQYAKGIKHPSEKQAMKIQDALHSLGNDLQRLRVIA